MLQLQTLFHTGTRVPYVLYTDTTFAVNQRDPRWSPLPARHARRLLVLEAEVFRNATLVLTKSENARQSAISDYGCAPHVTHAVGGPPRIYATAPPRRKILVTPGDPDQLAHALIRLLTDTTTATRMGHQAHQRLLTTGTWDAVGHRCATLIYHAFARPCPNTAHDAANALRSVQ